MSKEYYEGREKTYLRAALNTLGIQLNKTNIAVISAQNELMVSHTHLDGIVEKVCEGIISTGSSAKKMYVSSYGDSTDYGTIQSKYDLLMRNNIADSVEIMLGSDAIDGAVFVASANNVIIGMLMGAIRVNKPCIFVGGGIMSPIISTDFTHSGYTYWYQLSGDVLSGKLKIEQAEQIEKTIPSFLGANCDDYADISAQCLVEVLGLAVTGNCTSLSLSSQRIDKALQSGLKIVEMVKYGLVPKKIVTPNSIRACVCFDLAMGGCPSNLLNILALASEMKRSWDVFAIDLDKVEQLAKNTPVLFSRENSALAFTEVFENSGGVYSVLFELSKLQLANFDYNTYTNKPMTINISNAVTKNSNNIRTGLNPVRPSSLVKVLHGNLAEEGCICKYDGKGAYFIGPAKVYENEEMLVYALLDREIKKDTVIVVRNEGAKSGPGMREMRLSLSLLKGLGLEKDVALITDGRIADYYGGFVVGHITPEAGDNSMISLLQDGDVIEINPSKGKISVDIKAKEITKRRTYINSSQGGVSPTLKRFAKHVSDANSGCVSQ